MAAAIMDMSPSNCGAKWYDSQGGFRKICSCSVPTTWFSVESPGSNESIVYFQNILLWLNVRFMKFREQAWCSLTFHQVSQQSAEISHLGHMSRMPLFFSVSLCCLLFDLFCPSASTSESCFKWSIYKQRNQTSMHTDHLPLYNCDSVL